MRWELRSVAAAEVEDCRATLQSWQDPASFWDISTALRDRLNREEFFNIPSLGFLRDAWTLGRFATLSNAEAVKLESGQFPDGHVRIGGVQIEVEVTEALMPDRRRGLEFLPGTPQIVDDPFEEWTRRLDALPRALQAAVQKKASKSYTGKPTLVVYLNISAYGHRESETVAAIRDVLHRFGNRFGGLHVLWDGRLFSAKAV